MPTTIAAALKDRPLGRLDRWLLNLSVFVLPLGICLVTVLTFLFGRAEFSVAPIRTIEFRVLEDSSAKLSPDLALKQLQVQPLVDKSNNQLSEAPFWFLFSATGVNSQASEIYEFPSRHATEVACWNADDLKALGQASLRNGTGAIQQAKSGFVLSMANPATVPVLCKARFVGPARLTISLWNSEDFHASHEEFHRNAGLLDGGLIVLSVFILITALINRQKTYLLFSVWLLVNLRMAALSAGWDTQWLGYVIKPELLGVIRPWTLAFYYVITITLFKSLFQDEIKEVRYPWPMRFAQMSCIPMLVLALVLPYRHFLPVIWVSSAINSVTLIFYLVRILMKTRSSVAIWYGASMAITLFSSMYEVFAAALGFKGIIGSVNSVSAALSSSLLASLAIAEQMRQQHLQWLDAKAEMEHTFEAMPVGMFTLDLQGRFLSANPALMNMLSPDVLEPGSNAWESYFIEGAWPKLQKLVNSAEGGELEIKGVRKPRLGAKRFLVKAALAREKIEGSLQDVTDKSRAEEDLLFMACNDPLTRVLNRRGLEEAFGLAMKDLREGSPLSVAYLDLDRFKLINDLFGHAAGDEVLQQVCERISSMLTKGMSVGRVGGDEFLILMPDTKIPLAALIGRGLVDSIGSESFRVGDKAFHVRCCVGLIEVSPDSGFKDVLSTTDRACREAKTGKGDSLVVYEHNAAAFLAHEAELRLVEHLSTDAATQGMYIEMQPIMSLVAPHGSLNFEVLLRMRDTEGRPVPTERLIKAGESSGRMSVIDRWVLSSTQPRKPTAQPGLCVHEPEWRLAQRRKVHAGRLPDAGAKRTGGQPFVRGNHRKRVAERPQHHPDVCGPGAQPWGQSGAG
jgi:diguanylate cyclase (GGDEF)-like protein